MTAVIVANWSHNEPCHSSLIRGRSVEKRNHTQRYQSTSTSVFKHHCDYDPSGEESKLRHNVQLMYSKCTVFPMQSELTIDDSVDQSTVGGRAGRRRLTNRAKAANLQSGSLRSGKSFWVPFRRYIYYRLRYSTCALKLTLKVHTTAY